MRLEVDDIWCYCVGDTGALGIVDSVTSYLSDARFFSPKYRAGFWDGVVRMKEYDRSRKQYRFPSGFVERVIAALDVAGHSYEVRDNRCLMSPDPVTVMADGTELRPYQIDKIITPTLAKGRGVIKAPCGAGKTLAGGSLIAAYDCPTIWLTDRRQLMYQSQRALAKYLQRPIGMMGDDVFDLKPITVAMVQTLISKAAQLKDHLRQIQLLILDEAHHAQAETWFDVIQSIPAPYRVGLTASPAFTGEGMKLLGVTGELICEIKAQELIDLGYLVAPTIFFADYDTPQLPKREDWRVVKKMGIVENPARNAMIMDIAWEFYQQERISMTLTQEVAHGQNVTKMYKKAGIKTKFLYGKLGQQERDDIIGELADRKIDHMVANVQVVGEGWDLPKLSGCINALGTKGGGSKASGKLNETGKVTIQAIGRGMRPAAGKTDFVYVDLNDTAHKSLVAATTDRANALLEEGYGPYIKRWSQRTNAGSV